MNIYCYVYVTYTLCPSEVGGECTQVVEIDHLIIEYSAVH